MPHGVRESEAKTMAGIANDDVCRSLYDVSRLYGKGDEYILRSPVPDLDESRQPPNWHPAIQCIFVCQNVAGLWLKYGARSAKIETSLRREILLHVATIC